MTDRNQMLRRGAEATNAPLAEVEIPSDIPVELHGALRELGATRHFANRHLTSALVEVDQAAKTLTVDQFRDEVERHRRLLSRRQLAASGAAEALMAIAFLYAALALYAENKGYKGPLHYLWSSLRGKKQ